MAGRDEAALVAAAIAGRSLSEIAKAGGVSVSTAQRRLKQPAVIEQVREGRSRHRDETAGRLLVMVNPALRRLADLVEHDDPHVALRAINMSLRLCADYAALSEFDHRLRELEEQRHTGEDSAAEVTDDFEPEPEAGPGMGAEED